MILLKVHFAVETLYFYEPFIYKLFGNYGFVIELTF